MTMILNDFLPKFNEFLAKMVNDEVGMLLDIPGQIEKLAETVHDIQCIIADAEREQSNRRAIESWLMQLKDVMYDADDIIDLCQIKAKERLAGSSNAHQSKGARARLQLVLQARLKHILQAQVLPLVLIAQRAGIQFFPNDPMKIKKLNWRLEKIEKRGFYLGLAKSQIIPMPSDRVRQVDSIINLKTDPSIVVDDIVGEKIEEDIEMLAWF